MNPAVVELVKILAAIAVEEHIATLDDAANTPDTADTPEVSAPADQRQVGT
jgi:hypothetical protein